MQYDSPKPEDLFECRRCGECCRGYGGTYLDTSDIERIARYTGICREKLIEQYCQVSAGKLILHQKKNGFCIFWEGLCTIHPVKPRMCMAWPFIENLLHEPSNWDVMAEACPGMQTGFDKEDVVRCVRQKLEELELLRNESSCYTETGSI